VPPLDLNSAAGCVKALQSPNQATRYLAFTKLQQMQDSAAPELAKLWKSGTPRHRARALFLLAQIKGHGEEHLNEAMHDGDPNIRIAALRAARAHGLDVMAYIRALAKDASPQVRRECAIDLRHQSSSEAAGLWATLAKQHDGHDRWYLEALGIGADQQWDSFLNAWLKEVGDGWNTPAGRDIIWRSRSKKTPELLVKILSDKTLAANDRDHYMRAFDFIQGPEKDAALVELLTSATLDK